MQRYSLVDNFSGLELREKPEGEWVLFSDCEVLKDRLTKIDDQRHEALREVARLNLLLNEYRQQSGITPEHLRDYFAGQAMAGALGGEPGSHLTPEKLAHDSYAFADAMIAARK